MIVAHSNSLKSPDPMDLRIGQICINFRNKRIYTKNLTSKIVTCGRSFRKLIEYPEFIFDRVSTNSKFAFLRVLLKEKGATRKIYLTTSLPFLYLRYLNGVEVVEPLSNTYLGYGSNITKLKNVVKPKFSVRDLTDVNIATLNVDVHNYALTARYETYTPTKDVLKARKGNWYSRWQLLPEATKIIKLDDVTGTVAPYRILRKRKSNELASGNVYIEPLQIVGDSKPVLGGDLNGQGNAVFNQNYRTQLITLTKASDSATIDVTSTNCFSINCNNSVYLLSLSITASFNTTDIEYGKVKPFAIFISNFTGVLNFSNNVQFENGMPPVLQGSHHILTGYLVYRADSTNPSIYLFSKSTNLSKVL